MLTFAYTARDPATGENIKAEVQAENQQAAVKLIAERGLSPTNIHPKSDGGSILAKFKNRIKTKDKILYSRQLATLINAGLPLLQSLRSVASQTQNKSFKIVINQVIMDIEGGSSLSSAMAKHPKVFNQIYISLIEAGEASGKLDASLERLSVQQEKDAELISKVRGAMIYPLIVLVVMMGVIGFMIVKVLPAVEVLYDGLPGARLPLLTRVLLALSHAITKYWYIVIGLVVLLGFITSKWARTGPGKRIIDRAKMKAWPIGPLFMKMYMARFARTATTLVSSGVQLIPVLEITSKAINNVHIAGSINMAIEKVRGGKALSEAIANDPNFLSLVPDMLRIGEQSGTIQDMLDKTAEYYEKEVDNQIKAISTIIEPVLMVIMGIFAFIIVAAVLLPIYGLAGLVK